MGYSSIIKYRSQQSNKKRELLKVDLTEFLINSLSKNEKLLYLALGTLLTLIATTIGTILAWLFNLFSMRMRNKHDAAEKEKERNHLILKEVYLKAYSDISKIVDNTATMTPKQLSKNKNEIIQKDYMAAKNDFDIDKLELVSSLNTISALMNFIEVSTEIHFFLEQELLKFEKPFLDLYDLDYSKRLNNETANGLYNKLSAEYNKGVDCNPDIIALYKEYIDKNHERSNKINSGLLSTQKKYSIMMVEFEVLKKNKLADILYAADLLCIELRRDLKRNIEDDEYLNLRKKHGEKIRALITANADKTKSFIKEFSEQAKKEI